MFELLLSTGAKGYVSIEYPDSGPGNKWLLAGDPQLGYFGPVTSAELLTYSAYITHVIPSSGQASLKPDRGWLKFFYKGKVIYYSKTQIALASWEVIYQNGGVYGVDGPGLYPSPVGSPVNQYKPLTITANSRNWKLIPRLPRLSDVDPSPLPSGLAGEFARLMVRVTAGDTNPNFKPYYGTWDTFPLASVGLIAYNDGIANSGRDQGIESKSGTTTNKIFYFNALNPSDNGKTYASENWRAVLELESWTNVT